MLNHSDEAEAALHGGLEMGIQRRLGSFCVARFAGEEDVGDVRGAWAQNHRRG